MKLEGISSELKMRQGSANYGSLAKFGQLSTSFVNKGLLDQSHAYSFMCLTLAAFGPQLQSIWPPRSKLLTI